MSKEFMTKKEWELILEDWENIKEDHKERIHYSIRLVLDHPSKYGKNNPVDFELFRENILMADKGNSKFDKIDSDVNLFYKMDNDVYLILNAIISGPFVYVCSKNVHKINSYDEFKNLKFEDIYELIPQTKKSEEIKEAKERVNSTNKQIQQLQKKLQKEKNFLKNEV